MKLTPDRERKIAEAQRLDAEGLSRAEIGRRLGVTGGCIHKWLHPDKAAEYNRKCEAQPERAAAKREWDRENYKQPCKGGCGKEVWKHPSQSGYCPQCHPYHERRREHKHQRAEQIVKWWAEGLTHAQMAEKLGWSKNQMGVQVALLRQEGYDLPRRPQGRFKHHRESSDVNGKTSRTNDLAA